MRTPAIRSKLAALLCLASVTALPAQTLLVVNQNDATVSFINPATGRQTAVLAEHTPGVHGHEIAATPDGRTAFLPIYGSSGVGKPGIDGDRMLILDVASHSITGTVDFGYPARPHLPVFSPATGLLYVTTELDDSVTIVDPRTGKIVDAVPTGQEQSHMLAISSDGTRGYTANVGPGTVSILDLAARKTLAVVPIAPQIQRISISTDDKLVFTADQTRPQLAVLDTASRAIKAWVPLPAFGYGTAATHDGRSLLVALPSINQVAVVDLATLKVTRTLKVPDAPQEILIRPDGNSAYVSCKGGSVAEIALPGFTLRRLITAGGYPDGLAWAR